ncbi:hypothetical protein HDU76_008732 [Blyttiomyces sp. JEL0837]|nr:hypothetical protein HDU76_008732 [Blyttiomyces sp. JEL0837]
MNPTPIDDDPYQDYMNLTASTLPSSEDRLSHPPLPTTPPTSEPPTQSEPPESTMPPSKPAYPTHRNNPSPYDSNTLETLIDFLSYLDNHSKWKKAVAQLSKRRLSSIGRTKIFRELSMHMLSKGIKTPPPNLITEMYIYLQTTYLAGYQFLNGEGAQEFLAEVGCRDAMDGQRRLSIRVFEICPWYLRLDPLLQGVGIPLSLEELAVIIAEAEEMMQAQGVEKGAGKGGKGGKGGSKSRGSSEIS